MQKGILNQTTANSFYINCVKEISNNNLSQQLSPKNRDITLMKLNKIQERR